MSDKFENLLAVCSFLGTSGYNYHARGFFTALNKMMPVGIRNWSYDDNPYYLTNEQKAMMAASSGDSFSFGNCITVCLHETNHEDWFKHAYKSPKIAFNVWESTRQPEQFFRKMLEFDQIWVPSKWQKKYTVEQGAPEDRVFVIPEGIDVNRFKLSPPTTTNKFSSKDKFTFTIVGRWEYRKATTEMIKAFIDTFRSVEDVELLLLVDNPFDKQKMTTEDKMIKNGLRDRKIKILHKVSQDDYDQLIRETDCFVSCSRAEGWNLPLHEFMACGIPAICSDWSGQLEFAGKHASLVKIASMKKAWSEFGNFPGDYGEPDFDHLGALMMEHYSNKKAFSDKAREGSTYLRSFTWENAANIAMKVMEPLRTRSYKASIEPVKASIEPVTAAPEPVKASPEPVTAPKPINVDIIKKEKKIRSKDVIVIDYSSDSEGSLDQLIKTVEYARGFDKPVALVSHFPLPESVQVLVDYYIFDVDNTVPNYRLPIYYTFDSLKVSGVLDRPYYCLPIVKSLQNACKTFFNYDKLHFIEFDVNLDLEKHFTNVASNKDKDIVSYLYEGSGIHTDIITFKPSVMLDMLTTRTLSWDDYKKMAAPLLQEKELIFENWIYKIITNAGKTDSMVVLKPESIDIKSSVLRDVPPHHFIFSETDKDENILFIVRNNIRPEKFKIDKKFGITHCDGYSYVVFDKSITEFWIIHEDTTFNFDLVREPKGEFVFYDKTDIKCKEVKSLKGNTKHNVTIKNFFIDGAFVELLGPPTDDRYQVAFTDRATGHVVHKSEIGINNWTKTSRKYYTDWNVKVHCGTDELYNQDISYFQRRVLIVLDSKAMGDTLAWFPMVEEFRKKHKAHVICASFWNKFFKPKYPEIDFIEPGMSVPDIFAQFNVGCFDNDIARNKFNWRITPLQQVSADILGVVRHTETMPKIAYKVLERPIEERYVTISEHSTFMCKYWLNPGGWDVVVNYLNDLGYKVAAISKEGTNLEGVVNLTGKPIEESISNIHHSDLFIGMSSGPSWLSWALGKPLVLISGYSAEWAEMDVRNPLISRVINKDVCHGCFNDPSLPLERGNWRWCPRGRDFECSKMITPEMVIEGINKQLLSGGRLKADVHKKR